MAFFYNRIGQQGRTNPIALRLKGLMNWPSNVRHPFLATYIRHIFQGHIISEPGIRSSTSGIWINVTVFSSDIKKLESHPKVNDPVLDFSRTKIADALGRAERRIADMSSPFSKNIYMKNLFEGMPKTTIQRPVPGNRPAAGEEATSTEMESFEAVSPLLARAQQDGALEALQLYRDVPIHLQINVIKNPILNAEIMARFIAKQLAANKPLPRLYKTMLNKLSE
ncbi:hypothetical protein HDU76_004988 [Blyttiomyces sp. JEL0837]|nr:hypothetical protein HDU76_004988 [Blyttiomyces sp. JEL0837]